MASYLNLAFLARQLAQTGQLQALLEKTDNHGSTPLSYAAEMGHLDMFYLLRGMGAKLEATAETIFGLAVR
jgi:ankyrin repeat protein